MPMGERRRGSMGFGPAHQAMWHGLRVRPDRAVLEARLAYFIAWRNRLDDVIHRLSERLEADITGDETEAAATDEPSCDDPQE